MSFRARYLNKTRTGVPFVLLNTTILAAGGVTEQWNGTDVLLLETGTDKLLLEGGTDAIILEGTK